MILTDGLNWVEKTGSSIYWTPCSATVYASQVLPQLAFVVVCCVAHGHNCPSVVHWCRLHTGETHIITAGWQDHQDGITSELQSLQQQWP
jgi:hypothetical protein